MMIDAKEALELSEACFMQILKEDFEKYLPQLEQDIKAACSAGVGVASRPERRRR